MALKNLQDALNKSKQAFNNISSKLRTFNTTLSNNKVFQTFAKSSPLTNPQQLNPFNRNSAISKGFDLTSAAIRGGVEEYQKPIKNAKDVGGFAFRPLVGVAKGVSKRVMGDDTYTAGKSIEEKLKKLGAKGSIPLVAGLAAEIAIPGVGGGESKVLEASKDFSINAARKLFKNIDADSLRNIEKFSQDLKDTPMFVQEFATNTARQVPDNLKGLVYYLDSIGKNGSWHVTTKTNIVPSLEAGGWNIGKEVGLNDLKKLPGVAERIAEVGKKISAAEKVESLTADKRLAQKIKEYRAKAAQQEDIISSEKAQRFQEVENVLKEGGGMETTLKARGKLSGEYTKVPGDDLAKVFTQEDIDGVFAKINVNPNLNTGEKVIAGNTLERMLNGEVPPKSELDALAKAVDPEFLNELTQISQRKGLGKVISDFINIPKAFVTSGDFGASFRQGAFLSTRKEFWEAFPSQFKYAFNKRAYEGFYDTLKNSQDYNLIKSSNLHVGGLGGNEEAFYGADLIKKIPVLKWASGFVEGSNRAYVGFLDKLRVDLFRDLVKSAEKQGLDVSNNSKLVRDLGNYINKATGRGNLPEFLKGSEEILNSTLYSPKLMASRISLLSPATYLDPSTSKFVRKQAIRDLVGFSGTVMALTTLAQMNGAKVETDPRHTDFLRIQAGDRAYDITGGFQQYVRLMARLITNQTISAYGRTTQLGEGYKPKTRLSVAGDFLRSKSSPIASFVVDWATQKDFLGQPFELDEAAKSRVIPLLYQDVLEVFEEEGLLGLAKDTPGIFGFDVQKRGPTYMKNLKPTAAKPATSAKPKAVKKPSPVSRK